ncbi:hypothetical protein LguiA_027689 [Lonicera macranthoides]
MEASQKREFRYLKARNQKNSAKGNNIIEAIAQVNGGGVISQSVEEGGVTRMKILVRKQDLKQALEVMRGAKNIGRQSATPCLSLEQRLNLMRRRQMLRAKASQTRSWRPVLQSIPEEY